MYRLWCVCAVLCGGLVTGLWAAAETPANTRDTLVYKDGDRVQGSLISTSATEIVFRSDRFGELRVKAADAVVIAGVKSPEAAPVAKAATPPAAAPGAVATATPPKAAVEPAKSREQAARDEAEEERVTIWDRFSPGVLTAKVRNFFGPWGGRLAFSTEVISDVQELNTHALEAKLTRKWKKDEVQLSARYDYAETNDVPTTDIIKASGFWRHEFNKKWFSQYRPSAEWNHASKRQGVPNDYLLLQQEIGMGYHLYSSPTRTVRLGLSQNLFDIWNTAPTPDHTSRGVPSAFEEVELKLPWRMGLTQRGVFYPVRGQVDGWENRLELNKKLTETLSVAVRHEIRRNNPDGSAQDYTRLRLMFGLDF
ncbi:MAG TPA: DUF481 domain-containing protein [Opitutaceae bacterium]